MCQLTAFYRQLLSCLQNSLENAQRKNQTRYWTRGLDTLYLLPMRGGMKRDMLLPICRNDQSSGYLRG